MVYRCIWGYTMYSIHCILYRCLKRNVTDEEIDLTVKKDCHLLPLEDWQVIFISYETFIFARENSIEQNEKLNYCCLIELAKAMTNYGLALAQAN